MDNAITGNALAINLTLVGWLARCHRDRRPHPTNKQPRASTVVADAWRIGEAIPGHVR